MTKRILILPGGAVRGLIQSSFLEKYEEHFKQPCSQRFDLIVGGSVGSVNGAALAYGVKASILRALELQSMRWMFEKRSLWNPANWFRSRYRKERIFDVTRQFICRDARMSNLLTKFISATWCINTKSCVFLKSHDEKDENLLLEDVMAWSFAAPLYFNMLNDPVSKRTYTDPGIGDKNNPLDFAYQEALRLGWLGSESTELVEFLCVGTGVFEDTIPFETTRNYGYLRQLFASIRQGSSEGVSRYECEQMRQIAKSYPNTVKFIEVNCDITKDQSKFGNTDSLDEFVKLGAEMFNKHLNQL